jgi:hypothetical protein
LRVAECWRAAEKERQQAKKMKMKRSHPARMHDNEFARVFSNQVKVVFQNRWQENTDKIASLICQIIEDRKLRVIGKNHLKLVSGKLSAVSQLVNLESTSPNFHEYAG